MHVRVEGGMGAAAGAQAQEKVKPWVEKRPMSDANQAIIDFEAGKPRFRYVLVNEEQ